MKYFALEERAIGEFYIIFGNECLLSQFVLSGKNLSISCSHASLQITTFWVSNWNVTTTE